MTQHRACPVSVTFPSVAVCAAMLGVSDTTVLRHLKRYGHLNHLIEPAVRARPDRRKPVRVCGMTFSSQTEAAEKLGVDRRTIRNMATRAAARQTVMAAAMRLKAVDENRAAQARDRNPGERTLPPPTNEPRA